MPESKKGAWRLRSTVPTSQGPATSVDASFVRPGLGFEGQHRSMQDCQSLALARLILEDANGQEFYPMCLILSIMLAKGVTFPLSPQSSFIQLLWKWPRASQIGRIKFPNPCRAQLLSVPGCRNGTCCLPGVLTLA